MARRSKILGPNGEPVFIEDLTRDIAGPSMTGVRQPFSGDPASGLTPDRLGSILRRAEQGDPLDYFELAERIDRRVEAMLGNGAGAEAAALEAIGASRTAAAALGREEALRGDAEAMKSAHRRYARRQMTWLRKMEGLETVERDGLSDAEVAARIAVASGRG